jgi:2-keto-4-pentenoate hydratase/2-oxohepta-3-ene-1,7-dioic acid hydratase in catechol pathway
MRICRFLHNGQPKAGFYFDSFVVPFQEAVQLHTETTQEILALPTSDNLLDFLPPDGGRKEATAKLARFVTEQDLSVTRRLRIPTEQVQLLVPVPRPNKLFLLAGNYAQHIEEGGGIAAERKETFPYVFMKPASTTLTNPGVPIRIPKISPDTIDWELELAVVIGRGAKGISEDDALSVVAGYTIINDISNRRFRPNPERKQREKDAFFDWLHGKWFDSFCPCGPCILSADSVADPQRFDLELKVNDQVRQHSSTANQIFPVAAVIAFISSFVTLEPGDIISTGTPAGVGNTTQTYLHPGDFVEATIRTIGSLRNPVTAGD